VEERINTIVQNMFDGNRSHLFDALAQDGLSERAWRDQIREQLIVGAMRNLRVDSKVAVSPLAVREAYDHCPDDYATQPKAKVRMIIISKGASEEEEATQQAKVDAVLEGIKAGGDFAELAIANSEDGHAVDGGDRGWLERDMLRDDLAEVAFSIGIGEVSDAVDIGKQLCIVKVEDRVDAERISFEEVQPVIERKLRIEQSRDLYDSWIARLRKNGYVKIVSKSFTR
jgi:peptidyl-prolyl cis-trans isomerase SurA